MEKIWKSLAERIDLIVLLLCLVMSYGVWSYGINYDKSDTRRLEEQNAEVVSLLSGEAGDIFNFIDGVAGLYSASNEVSTADLATYMQSTSENTLNGDVLRINFVARVPNRDISKYEKIIQKVGWPGYQAQIVPGYDDQYLVTQTVEKNGSISLVSGLNMLSETYRKSLVDDVINGRERSIVAVPTINYVPEYTGPGFIFADSVVKDGELVGFVTALVSREALSSQVRDILGENVGWMWYQNDQQIGGFELDVSNHIDVTREIKITPSVIWKIDTHTQKNPSLLWNIILGIGILISFLIYVLVYSLSSANARGIELARQMTQDLQKYKLAIDSASNHIVITDENGVVIYANKSAQKLTGYESSEIIGKTPRLWGGLMGKDFYEKFWHEIKINKKVFSGLFSNKRKNGELYTAEATVSPIINDKGVLIGFVGVEEDVTEERRILKEREESLSKLAKFNELMLGREMKMVELKKEISKLKGES